MDFESGDSIPGIFQSKLIVFSITVIEIAAAAFPMS